VSAVRFEPVSSLHSDLACHSLHELLPQASSSFSLNSTELNILRIQNAHEVIKVNCLSGPLQPRGCERVCCCLQQEVAAAQAKEHVDRLAKQAASKLPPTLQTVRQTLAQKRADEEAELERSRAPKPAPLSLDSLSGSATEINVVVRWVVPDSDRLGQSSVFHVTLQPGETSVMARSDVAVRRPSYSVVHLPPLALASAPSSALAKEEWRSPLMSTIECPARVSWDFSSGPVMITLRLRLHHVASSGLGPLSFKLVCRPSRCTVDVGTPPDTAPCVWVGARSRLFQGVQAGSTLDVVYRVCVLAPGVYDLNQFVVDFVAPQRSLKLPSQCVVVVESAV
jgi:hypothetical protein